MWKKPLLQYAGAVSSAGAMRCCDLLPQEGDTSPRSGIRHPWAVRGGHAALLSSLPHVLGPHVCWEPLIGSTLLW